MSEENSIDFITQIYQGSKRPGIPAIFLDRDGTIIEETDNLTSKEEIKLIAGAIEGIKIFNKLGYPVLVVTNQPVVARGWISEDELRKINDIIQGRFKKEGASILAIYSCPHHPQADIKKYRIQCNCRKPGTLMFKKATSDFKIDLAASCSIGDRTADIKAGKNLKIKTYLVKTGFGGSDNNYPVKADYKVGDLLAAAQLIAKGIN